MLEHYTYDDNDQVVRVDNKLFDNDDYTSTYSYDSRSNVLSKNLYNYTRSGTQGTVLLVEKR